MPEAPKALADRRVEITGPVERKMMINALNSGAQVFMADFEDANSPTWDNVIAGQVNLQDAVRGTIELVTAGQDLPAWRRDGHRWSPSVPGAGTCPRSTSRWTASRCRPACSTSACTSSTTDGRALSHGFGPYFYLPKLESHLEARLWNDVMFAAEDALGLDRGSIRATVLIETITAAFEMDEILYELRDHICGLNAGRWDYIFSVAKRFHADPAFVLPDRSSVTMTAPFMRAFTELLVKTCHRRGAHAIGGMSAFIPNRRKPEVTEAALAKVTEDKRREAGDGFDGTWVAHPDLVAAARAEFDAVLGDRPNQLERQRPDVRGGRSVHSARRAAGRPTGSPGPAWTPTSRSACATWLLAVGHGGRRHRRPDGGRRHRRDQPGPGLAVGPPPGRPCRTARRSLPSWSGRLLDETVTSLRGRTACDGALVGQARAIFEQVALADDFPTFLTLPAYELLP